MLCGCAAGTDSGVLADDDTGAEIEIQRGQMNYGDDIDSFSPANESRVSAKIATVGLVLSLLSLAGCEQNRWVRACCPVVPADKAEWGDGGYRPAHCGDANDVKFTVCLDGLGCYAMCSQCDLASLLSGPLLGNPLICVP